MADETTIAAGIDLSVNAQNALKGIQAVDKATSSMINSFQKVSDQVDAVIQRIENLTAVAAKANQTVNKTFNNANTYNTQNQTTKIHTSKASETIKVGDTVYSFRTGDRSSSAKNARKAVNDSMQAELSLKNELINKQKEYNRLLQEQANLTGEKVKNYKQDSDTRKRNSEANLLNAQTRAAHPEMFMAGALLRSPRYQFGKAFEGVGAKVGTFGVGSDKLEGKAIGGVISAIGTIMKSPVAGGAAALMGFANGILEVGKAATQAYAEIESIRTQLGVVFSSQTQADSMFGELAQYATKSPFGVQQTSELAILLKQSGVYASDLMDILKMIGDTAGGNMEKMKRIANNYAQIVSIGKASMLDMRQFAYAGIPIFEAVSKELGVSQQELRKLISDGKVTSDIIEKVFKDLTGINGIFENATEKGAKTLKARLQNLADAKQLAMAGVGDWVVNYGTQTGGDSYALRIVTGLEDIYAWLKEKVNTVNIEKSVNVIENRDSRIGQISDAIKYLESKKDRTKDEDDILKGLKLRFSEELNKRDIDVERNAYKQSYDMKTSAWREYLQRTGGFERKDLSTEYMEKEVFKGLTGSLSYYEAENFNIEEYFKERIAELKKRKKDIDAKYNLKYAGAPGDTYTRIRNDKYNDMEYQGLTATLDDFKNALKAYQSSRGTTEKDKQAKAESNVIDAQSLAADSINKLAKEQGSYYSLLQELSNKQKSSDEAKLKAEQDHTAELLSAQKALKELNGHIDDKGILNMTSFKNLDDLARILDTKIFATESKLSEVEEKSDKKLAEDRPEVEAQIKSAVNYAINKLENNGYSLTADKYSDELDSLTGIANDREFYKQLPVLLNKIYTEFKDLAERDATSFNKNEAERVLKILGVAGLRLSTIPGVENVDPSSDDKGKNDFIPLWKRILAEYTGLTTQGMLNTRQTLDNYANDMALRNMASGVMEAAMKSGGIRSAMNLLKPRTDENGNFIMAKLKNDTSYTVQFDWQKTAEEIHNFATQLSSATEVVSAYKSGLESEYDTFVKLVSAGHTQAESQDLKEQKIISVEKLKNLEMDSGAQLVNAYGESFIDAETDKEVFLHDDGKFYDAPEGGKEVAVENLKVNDKLADYIEKALPKLMEKIDEATEASLGRSVIDALKKESYSTVLQTGLMSRIGASETSAFALQNLDYLTSMFDSALTAKKASNASFKDKTNEQIFLIARNGDNEAAALIKEVFDTIDKSIKDLMNSDEYKRFKADSKPKTRDDALNAAILKASGKRTDNTYDLVKDTAGSRSTRNWFAQALGYEKGYDIEDAYIASAKAGAFGLDKSRFENMSNEDILKELSFTDKLRIEIELGTEDAKERLEKLGKNVTSLSKDFAADAFTSSMETWGEALATGADASEALSENMRQLSASLMKNLGSMVTQAGLSLAISSIGNMPMVLAGLAIAAAGGGMSFLGGMLGAKAEDKNEEDDKYEKLLRIKEDLSDLLKQAREDAIYYENTVRHRNALSTNDSLGRTTKVNDAIITPSGDVITTHPDDYLIATKQPNTLFGGSGTPNIKFNFIDKSTGVSVVSQKATYNQKRNELDFTVLIENKVKEIIAGPSGDDAFNARSFRLNGKQYVG